MVRHSRCSGRQVACAARVNKVGAEGRAAAGAVAVAGSWREVWPQQQEGAQCAAGRKARSAPFVKECARQA